MNFRHILTAAALAVTFLFPTGARAQADTTLVSTALWTACPGATVRLAVRDAETVTGRCGTVADGRLVVRADAVERQVQLTEVRSVEVRRSRIAQGAATLGVVGLLAGWVVGIPGPEPVCVVGGCIRESGYGDNGRGAGVGAVVGAGLGALVGSRLKYWQARYP
jgi:hypothetical protein